MDQPRTDEKLASQLAEKFDLKVTVNDIRKCDPDLVQKIYMHFLRDLGANLEQIKGVPFGATDNVQQYPDMYRHVMHTMGVARVIKHYLCKIYGDTGASFIPADIYDPKPKKTRQYFWMLLEFTNQPQITDCLNEIENQVSIKREKSDEMEENIEKLREQLHKHRLEKAEHKIQEEEEEKRIAEDKEKLQEAQERKINLKSMVEKMKLTNSSISTTIKEAEIDVIQAGDRVKELRGQVVQDSERVEIEERESRLAQLRTGLQEKKEHLVQLQHNVAMVEQYKETMATMMATLRDIQQEHNKEKESLGTMSQLSQDMSTVQEQREDKAMQIQVLNQQIESQQAKISQMHQTWKMNKESILEDIKQHKQTLEESRRNKTESEIAYQDMENIQTRIINETSQVKEQIMRIDSFIASQYQKILVAMESNNQSVQNPLAEIRQLLDQYTQQQ